MSKIYNDAWMEEKATSTASPSSARWPTCSPGLADHTPITIDAGVGVTEAIGLMRMHGISQLPVMDGNQIKGVLHEKRLLEEALKAGPRAAASVADLADSNYCVVEPDTDVSDVTDLLRKVKVALVFEDGTLTNILSRIDLLDHIARRTGGRSA